MNYKRIGIISLVALVVATGTYFYFATANRNSILGNAVTTGKVDYSGLPVSADRTKIDPPVLISPQPLPSPQPPKSDPKSDSGVQGKVMIGPTCPGPIREGDNTCNDKPYAAQLVIWDNNQSKIVARFASDKNGNFKVALPAGTYVVGPVAEKSTPPYVGYQTFTVKAHQYTTITIQFDSGIR